jgi:hypothetical protein
MLLTFHLITLLDILGVWFLRAFEIGLLLQDLFTGFANSWASTSQILLLILRVLWISVSVNYIKNIYTIIPFFYDTSW